MPALGRVVSLPAAPEFSVEDPAGVVVPEVTDYLLQLLASDCTTKTVRAYAMSLLRFFRFLWAVDISWRHATEAEVRDFVLWARSADKFEGAKRASGAPLAVNVVTGKRQGGTRYSPSTINHTLTVVRDFFEFQARIGEGPVLNPVPSPKVRPNGHHNPRDSFERSRRSSLRQKEPHRLPRAIPDGRFDELFRRLGCYRDRALFAFYVSTGARATELLGLTNDRINYGDQLIGVIRKGGALQWLPAAPDAFVWLRLYQLEKGTGRPDQPVWLTLRQPHEKLSYDAFRAVITRANAGLGSNWTTHDLRHTFAIRALNGGMPLHEVQELLGHASLATTSIYATPHQDDLVARHRAIFAQRGRSDTDPPPVEYDADEMAELFRGRL